MNLLTNIYDWLSIEDLLEHMQKPEGYDGPELEFVLKDSKEDNLAGLIDNLLKKYIPSGKKIAMF